jgi:hypothetical protein
MLSYLSSKKLPFSSKYHSERKQKIAAIFIAKMSSRVKANRDFIMGENRSLLKNYKAVIGG